MRALSLVFFACAVSACASSGWGNDVGAVPERASCTVELAVPNMACAENCPGKVRAALSSVRGVQEVDVDFGSRSATVTAEYPACSEGGFEDMLESLHDAGYDGQIVGSS